LEKSKLKIIILIVIAVILSGMFLFFRFSPTGTSVLWNWSGGGRILLPLVLVSALIDSVNPCAFSILLLTIAFLFSIGSLRASILKIGSSYIFGIFSAYILIGLGILGTLHIFNTPHFMGRLGAILLIILGIINLINEFFPSFPVKLKIPQSAHHKMAELVNKSSLPAAYFLGVLVGLCEFPCTGGPYLMVLGLLHDTKTYFSGVGYLFLYNVIFVLPLVITLLLASNKLLLQKAQILYGKEKRLMRLGGGIAMIILGVIILLF